MKLAALFESTALTFRDHVPSEEWLEGKRRENGFERKNQFGAPKAFGSETGDFNRVVLLPVNLLKTFRGRAGEQNLTRGDDLAYLVKYMQENNHLPVLNDGKQRFPYITVDESGEPWICDGNHRIKAAAQLGWKALPVQVVYFSGGEREKGLIPPEKVKAYDARGHALGYSVDDFRGILEKAPE